MKGLGFVMSIQRRDIPALAAEFTEAHPRLDPLQQGLVLAALRLLGEGRPFGPKQLAERVDLSVEEVAAHLAEWPMVQRDRRGKVVAFSGLTLKKTSHSLEVDGRTLYAWCALDTLFLPELLGRPARIRSAEPGGGQTVTLDVDGPSVRDVEPDGAVLTLHEIGGFDLRDVVGTYCCFVHFFSTEHTANAWAERNPGTYVVSIADGFEYGRLYNHQRFAATLPNHTNQTTTPEG